MHIELSQLLYMAIVSLTVISAIMTVIQNHPVRSVLFLVLTFFGSSMLWMLIQAEFLSLILVLVYVGAVMTLFLFVVMMLNVDAEALQSHLFRLLPLGILIVGGLAALFITALHQSALLKSLQSASNTAVQHQIADVPQHVQSISNTEAIGSVLYTQYVYPFELAAVLLLVAMVSAITLVHRATVRSKRQNIRHQIMTEAKGRITLVSLTDTRGTK